MLWEAKSVTFPSPRRMCSLLSWQPAEKTMLQISPSLGGGRQERAPSLAGTGQLPRGRMDQPVGQLSAEDARPLARTLPGLARSRSQPHEVPLCLPADFLGSCPPSLVAVYFGEARCGCRSQEFSNTVEGKTLQKLGSGYLGITRKLHNGSRVRPESITYLLRELGQIFQLL